MNNFSIITFLIMFVGGGAYFSTSESLENIPDNVRGNISENKNVSVCVKHKCSLICQNGNSLNLENDLAAIEYTECDHITDLVLHNYRFPNKMINKGFLGPVFDIVQNLFIYASNIETIEDGAFGSPILAGLHLEDLELTQINKQIFMNLSNPFKSFSLIQRKPLEHIEKSFLETINYRIEKLTVRTGLTELDLIGGGCPLSSLEEVDLSYNNFEGRLNRFSFTQLSLVETLNLTDSEITNLPKDIFLEVANTLKILDLSYNKLKVLSNDIFGWKSLDRLTTIGLAGNPWHCSCWLQIEMTNLLAFQTENVYCDYPDKNILITNESLCFEFELSMTSEIPSQFHFGQLIENLQTSTQKTEQFENNSDSIQTTELVIPPMSSTLDPTKFVTIENVECLCKNDLVHLSVQWPSAHFDIVKKNNFEVDIVVRNHVNRKPGILWFSKVTLQYYNMEINHKEYGLGCTGQVEYITTIDRLVPDMAYTFCLVLKDQITISPFSCKSVYIDSNLEVEYNAWLTKKMKAPGISLLVLGILFFIFLGSIIIFVLIKKKPVLVKGSKRVATQKNNSSNIIVFPKDKTLKKFKLMEERKNLSNPKGTPFQRLSLASVSSVDSIQSYINPGNLYEIIPAYHQCLSTLNKGNEVHYADVPLKFKRTSNDPLPEIPAEDGKSNFTNILKIEGEHFYETEESYYV